MKNTIIGILIQQSAQCNISFSYDKEDKRTEGHKRVPYFFVGDCAKVDP